MSQVEWETLTSWVSLVVACSAALLLSIQFLPDWRFTAGAAALMRGAIARMESAFGAIACRIALCFVFVPALSFCANLTYAIQRGIPMPLIHDEFSYLLAADTFAHGRVTNPTPPLWEHFETPQELMRPTYMSKYPPGQGIALAIGQIVTGEPIVGVWLSTAAACAAIYWMLLVFVSSRWALVGGVIAALHPQLIEWSRVYWGGSVAVLGGALLLGSCGRLMRRPGAGVAIILAISLVILANSRPYEGLLVSIPLLATLLLRAITAKRPFAGPVVVPATIVILIALVGMGWYNHRIAGNPLRMPFAEYAGQYDVYPKFWFLPTRPVPAYRNASLKWVHLQFERGEYPALRTVPGLLAITWTRLRELVAWQAKPTVFLLPLLCGMFRGGDERIRWIRITLGVFLVGLCAENFLLPHYAAPILPVMVLLIILGWGRLWGWTWRGRVVGRVLAMSIGCGFLASAVIVAEKPVSRDSMIMGRAALPESAVPLQTGRHLIFVRYAPAYSFHNEYVFNAADIDASRIVWARSFGRARDRQLVERFPGRLIWRLTVGKALNLDPYSP